MKCYTTGIEEAALKADLGAHLQTTVSIHLFLGSGSHIGHKSLPYSWCTCFTWLLVRYLVYCPSHSLERLCWGIAISLLFILASVLTVLYVIDSRDTVLSLKEGSVLAPLPPLYICPNKQMSLAQRGSVEKLLPVMKDLWAVWDRIVEGEGPAESLLPWGNNSKAVGEMREVMYEGVLLSLPPCSDLVSTCGREEKEDCCKDARPVHTLVGPCLILGSPSSLSHTLPSLLTNHALNLTVEIDSVNSPRIGHPVVSAPHWGHSYLCDSQWGDREAEVMCRSMGYGGGRRHRKIKPTLGLANSMARFGRFLGKFQCSGGELALGDCSRTEHAGCGLGEEEEISMLLCDPGGLQHNRLLQAGTRGFSYLKVRQMMFSMKRQIMSMIK